MAFVKDVNRKMQHLHRQLFRCKLMTKQLSDALDAAIAANGGEADAGIVAGWTAPQFAAGFKSLRDAMKVFNPPGQ